jgi:hypothetical protein
LKDRVVVANKGAPDQSSSQRLESELRPHRRVFVSIIPPRSGEKVQCPALLPKGLHSLQKSTSKVPFPTTPAEMPQTRHGEALCVARRTRIVMQPYEYTSWALLGCGGSVCSSRTTDSGETYLAAPGSCSLGFQSPASPRITERLKSAMRTRPASSRSTLS